MSRPRTHLGHDELTPLILGVDDGSAPVLVEGTGLFLAVRKGDQRWVTGTMVRKGLASGSLIQISTGREPAMTPEQLAEAVGDDEPGPVTPAPPDVPLMRLAPQPSVIADAGPKTGGVANPPLPLRAPRPRPVLKKAATKKAAPRKR